MPSDIRLAFAHPEDRAAATSPDNPRDRISLRDHVVSADIGAFQTERGRPQRLRFNIVVEVRPADAPIADDVDRILSYDRLTEAVAAELAGDRLNLLETLAERVAERILAEPPALRVFVRVEKLDRGPGALGVEIVRARASAPLRSVGPGEALHPVVAHLDAEAVMAPDLGARLDRLIARGRPLVLTVGLPEAARPAATAALVQQRIDLLAIEQMAWVLAGRDRRCLVVASRTELDHAIRQGRTVVWAPAKLILDSHDSPRGATGTPVTLALWLAEQLAAECLIVHGATLPPAGSRVPVERA
ncbi:MAG: dihydroneopterin aldolase [Gemmobacter sp.]|jgi:dihydroneopterin aldolase